MEERLVRFAFDRAEAGQSADVVEATHARIFHTPVRDASARVRAAETHAAQSEFFYILSGQATVRRNDERFTVGPGEAIMHPPGEAHQIRNTGTEELRYLLIADNPPLDPCIYPDSGKAQLLVPGGKTMVRYTTADDLDYFDCGE
jgi:uncharacterized cupin superfamily protein